MLTLFTCPKPFVDPHISIIQRNAIMSWTHLRPRPEIILCGNEKGVSEICRELGLKKLSNILRNEFGTPLVNDIFKKAQESASFNLICYANADIVLMDHFIKAIERVSQLKNRFLMVGRRWDIEMKDSLDFNSSWEYSLRNLVLAEGRLRDQYMIDYFIFPKGLWNEIPAFALGRFWWDQWLLYQARLSGVQLIDATACIMAVHQNHAPAHRLPTNFNGPSSQPWFETPEAKINLQLSGGRGHQLHLFDCTCQLTEKGIEPMWGSGLRSRARSWRWLRRFNPAFWNNGLKFFNELYTRNIHRIFRKSESKAL